MIDVTKLNQKEVVDNSIGFIKLFMKDEQMMAAESADETYEAVKKYADIPKEKFLELLNTVLPVISEKRISSGTYELNDEELSSVVGGSLSSWLSGIWESIKEGWNDGTYKKLAIGAAIGLGIAVAGMVVVSAGISVGTAISTSSVVGTSVKDAIIYGISRGVGAVSPYAKGVAGVSAFAGFVGSAIKNCDTN